MFHFFLWWNLSVIIVFFFFLLTSCIMSIIHYRSTNINSSTSLISTDAFFWVELTWITPLPNLRLVACIKNGNIVNFQYFIFPYTRSYEFFSALYWWKKSNFNFFYLWRTKVLSWQIKNQWEFRVTWIW